MLQSSGGIEPFVDFDDDGVGVVSHSMLHGSYDVKRIRHTGVHWHIADVVAADHMHVDDEVSVETTPSSTTTGNGGDVAYFVSPPSTTAHALPANILEV